MPGRRLSTAPSIKKIKPQRQKGKRSLNALSIAEQQNPERSKIRRSRLGRSEDEPAKRKRQDLADDEDLGDSPDQVKRRKAGDKDRYGNDIEVGSDSSGNEWVVGQVDADDDSDLDSDEAMGESDLERFEGFAFRRSSATKPRDNGRSKVPATGDQGSHTHDIDLHEYEEDDGVFDEEGDGLGDDAVDLDAMLKASDDDEEMDPWETGLEDDNITTDVEIAAEEDGSTLSYSGDEDGPGDSARYAALQAFMSTINGQQESSMYPTALTDIQESTAPSAFNLTARRKITLGDMMASNTDPNMRKSLRNLAKDDTKTAGQRGDISKKVDVPLPKRQQDRLDRAAAYEQSKETLKRWIDTIKHNRRAEHLSFPLKDPKAVAAQGSQHLLPTSHSTRVTDLENTIQNILHESGLAAPNGKSDEDRLQAFEELQTNKMPLEEVQERRAELRRARELLFREEVRAKRIKKIKSKAYRKVHRKEKERTAQQEKVTLTAARVDDSESEQERRDRRRAEERMGARHRESKWAKGVKDSGRAKWDEDARGGVTEMARRGEELRRRIEGKRVVGDEDGLGSTESESDANDGSEDEDAKSHERLHKLNEGVNVFDSNTRGSKLASMDFMKKAEAARKARNDADTDTLRKELAGEDKPSEEESMEGPGRQSFGPMENKHSRSKMPPFAQRSEFEEREDSGDEDGGSRHMENELEIMADTSITQGKTVSAVKPSLVVKKKVGGLQRSSDQLLEADVNPWLTSKQKISNSSKRRTQDNENGAIVLNNTTPVEAIPDKVAKSWPALKGAREAETARRGMELSKPPAPVVVNHGDEDGDDDTGKLPFVLRNQDLVRKAFAGDEIVADFEKEKQQTVEDEQDKMIDNTLPGWGNWTGAGIGKKQQKHNKGRNLTKEPGIAKEKRQDAKLDRVIINEKRVKKNARYLASNLPHPFETRQQYERSLRLPVGPEWTTKETFQSATKPRILMKQGVIAPMTKPMV